MLHASRVKMHQHAYSVLWSSNSSPLSFHILNLFPGFMQVYLILACAGLLEVCVFCNLFVSEQAPQRRAPLIFHHLSSAWLPMVLLGPASPNWTFVLFWYSRCHGCRLTFTSLRDTQAAGTTKGPVMISLNFLISQLFALHVVVSVTFSLLPPPPLQQACALTILSRCSQFLCSNRKADK